MGQWGRVGVWRCRGDDRRLWAEPIEESVQLIFPLHSAWWLCAAHLTPSDLLHSSPQIPHIVLLEFSLQLPPVGVFTGLQRISVFTLLSSSLSPDLNALFFLLRRAFRSLVIHGLLLGKQSTVRVGMVVCSQNLMYSVMQSVMLSRSSPCGPTSTSKFVDSKQSCSASAASWVHLLMLFGVSRTRLWSDLPRGGGLWHCMHP